MGENYGRKMMHGVMKAKWINVGETKFSKLLSKISPEAKKRDRTLPTARLIQRSAMLNSLIKRFITIKMRIWECLRLLMRVLEMGFLVKYLDMLKWPETL